jgi:very-short-patch-repair endonuclease
VAGFFVDFYCGEAKLAIEADGAVHHTAEARIRDAKRTQVLESFGICVVRFSNDEIEHNLTHVLAAIAECAKLRIAESRLPHP